MKNTPSAIYDLIPSQQTMYLMFKYTFSKQISQIPTSFSIEKDIDFEILTQALNIEFERNDSLRLRFIKQDKQIKEYFLPSLRMSKVPCKYFRNAEQQEEFFTEEVKEEVPAEETTEEEKTEE